MREILHGLRVVDISDGVAGPVTAMLLADYGAHVIRVEPPAGDPSRRLPGFEVWNRGKEWVRLDLERSDGRAELHRLVTGADVVIESCRPDQAMELGLDDESLRRANDRLVHCSITGYGHDSVWRDRPGHDALVAARTGMQFEQPGWRDGPIFLRSPLASYAASMLASTAIGSALLERERSGRGQWVETSLLQGVLLFNCMAWTRVEMPPPGCYATYQCRSAFPTPCYEAGDGRWMHPMPDAVGVALEELDLEPAHLPGRPVGPCRDVVPFRAAVADLYRRRTRDEWTALFQERGVRCQPVQSVDEAFTEPQVLHNGGVVEIEIPEVGSAKQFAFPIRFSEHTPRRLTAAAPIPTRETVDWYAAPPTVHPDSEAATATRAPLAGVRVLDFGLALAGPFGPMILSDLGADVIRVENIQAQRSSDNQVWAACQRGKRSIVVDLKSDAGRAIVERLVATADVIHHNMRPGAAERLGIGFEQVHAQHPRIVYCHVNGFGETGPKAQLPGSDQMAQALCGLEEEQGAVRAGGKPTWLRFGMCDHTAGMLSVIGVLHALVDRERTGLGQFVETSLLDAAALLVNDVTQTAGDIVLPRFELDRGQYGLSAWCRLFATLDGWLCVVADTVVSRRSFCRVVGLNEGLADDESEAADGDVADHLTAFLAAGTSRRWFDALDAAGVPCEIPDADFASAWFDDADLRRRGLVTDYVHRTWGKTEQMGRLFEFSRNPITLDLPPVVPGADGDAILRELGYSEDEMRALHAEGVTMPP